MTLFQRKDKRAPINTQDGVSSGWENLQSQAVSENSDFTGEGGGPGTDPRLIVSNPVDLSKYHGKPCTVTFPGGGPPVPAKTYPMIETIATLQRRLEDLEDHIKDSERQITSLWATTTILAIAVLLAVHALLEIAFLWAVASIFLTIVVVLVGLHKLVKK